MRVFLVLRKHVSRRLMVGAALFGVVSGALSTGLLSLINEYLFQWGVAGRGKAILLFLILLPLVALARFSSSITLAHLGLRTAFELQVKLARRILGAPMRKLEEQGAHRLMVALTDDITSLSDALSNIPNFFINFAIVTGCLVYMGYLSWVLLTLVTVFLIVGVLTYQLPLLAGVRRQELAREVEDDLFHFFRGVTRGTKELKMHRRRRVRFVERFMEVARLFRRRQFSAARIFIAANSWGNLIFFVCIGFLIFYVPTILEELTLPLVGSYVVVLLYMQGPLQALLNNFPLLTEADIALRKIERLGISLTEEEPERDAGEANDPSPGWNQLDLRGVGHTYHHEYEDSEFTLGPLDLTFAPGEVVFIIGGNGSGKTTLAKVLVGLYPPEQGQILLDGEPIDEESRVGYRQMFSVVFSDAFLFRSLLGLEAEDLDERATGLLGRLQLQHKVRVEDGRLSTISLSQGQRRRLALMTGLLEDRPIYLFDEWAAAQDPEFKRFFYYEILPSLKARGKLVLVISHDDRYFGVGDRVIKLESGQVLYDDPVQETEYATA